MISRALNALRDVFRYRSLSDEMTIERLTAERDVERERFKLAATDLAKQAEDIKMLNMDRGHWRDDCLAQKGLVSALTEKNVELVSKLETARGECDALRHDANMWRNSLKRSRDRKKGVGRG